MTQIQTDYKRETAKFISQYLFALSTPPAVKERVLSQAASAALELALGILKAVLTD